MANLELFQTTTGSAAPCEFALDRAALQLTTFHVDRAKSRSRLSFARTTRDLSISTGASRRSKHRPFLLISGSSFSSTMRVTRARRLDRTYHGILALDWCASRDLASRPPVCAASARRREVCWFSSMMTMCLTRTSSKWRFGSAKRSHSWVRGVVNVGLGSRSSLPNGPAATGEILLSAGFDKDVWSNLPRLPRSYALRGGALREAGRGPAVIYICTNLENVRFNLIAPATPCSPAETMIWLPVRATSASASDSSLRSNSSI